MFVTVLKTFVKPSPQGMIVGNAGETVDVPESLVEELKISGLIDDDVPAPLAAMTAPVLGDDGEPLNPPAGDAVADMADPTAIEPAKNKGGRPRKAAPSLDAPAA